MPRSPEAEPPLAAFVRYFLTLGTIGFGGPIALVGAMRRDLVEQRGWVSERDYGEGLALSQLAPGPLAAQLAIYLGWVRAGVAGATLTGLAFVLPSFVIVLVLSAAYVRYGGMPWIQAAFYGVGPAVIAVIARSAVRLARTTLRADRWLWLVFAVNALLTAWLQSELVASVLLSGALLMMVRGAWRPRATAALVLVPLPVLVAGAASLPEITWFFAKAGALVFGSGLAIVPFLYGGVVSQHHWLTERQFLDAVAVAMITPGPVVITVAFIGFLVAGVAGALCAALGMFLPAYLFVVIPARRFRSLAERPGVRAFVDGVTAAATGCIAGAAIVLARRAIVDLPSVAICLVALLVLQMFRRLPEPVVILAAGAAGLLLASAA
jgi:chromate transporter